MAKEKTKKKTKNSLIIIEKSANKTKNKPRRSRNNATTFQRPKAGDMQRRKSDGRRTTESRRQTKKLAKSAHHKLGNFRVSGV